MTDAVEKVSGFDARYMAGGHYGWKAIKGDVKRLEIPDGSPTAGGE